MSNFCAHCGAPAGASKFCGSCGQPQTPATAPPPLVATVPPKPGSALKIVLVTLAVLALLAVAGAVTAAVYVKHRVHDGLAQLKERTGIDVPAAIDEAQPDPGPKRDGCLLLPRQEAQDILGIALTRADGAITGSQDEHCDYYADAAAAQAARDQVRERIDDLKKSDSTRGADDLAKVEAIVKGIGAGTNDGATPILQITVFRGNGRMATAAFNAGGALLGVKPEPIPGPWDEAVFGPMNSTLTVRKGRNGFMIDLRQVPQGHAKGLELAKLMATRL